MKDLDREALIRKRVARAREDMPVVPAVYGDLGFLLSIIDKLRGDKS